MDEIVAAIRAFVGGDMTAPAFRDLLYANAAFEPYLSNDPHLRPGNYVGTGGVYLYLLQLDYDDPADALNAQGALTDFMDRNGIAYTRTNLYQDMHRMILDAQPKWLNVDTKYVQEQMMPAAGQRQGDELREWLRAEFRRRFRCVSALPKWLQAPAWPIGPNGPLVFLGQVKVSGYFHDEAKVYVFHDAGTGMCETVTQVM